MDCLLSQVIKIIEKVELASLLRVTKGSLQKYPYVLNFSSPTMMHNSNLLYLGSCWHYKYKYKKLGYTHISSVRSPKSRRMHMLNIPYYRNMYLWSRTNLNYVKAYQIAHVLGEQNMRGNVISKLPNTRMEDINHSFIQDTLEQLGLSTTPYVAFVTMRTKKLSWITLIMTFIKNRTLPIDHT